MLNQPNQPNTKMKTNSQFLKMKAIFIHGFLGSDQSFCSFPADLSARCNLETLNFSYETKGSNADAIKSLLIFIAGNTSVWDKVLLIAHSMGGIIAADAQSQCDERIIGILAFDTPYFGLAPNVLLSTGSQKATKALADVSSSFGSLFKSKTNAPPSAGWGLAASVTLAAGAFAAYNSSSVVRNVVHSTVNEHAKKLYDHAEFLGPLWQVNNMNSRMDSLSNTFFHGFYLQMQSDGKTFISPPPSQYAHLFSAISVDGSDEIDCHMYLFEKRSHYESMLNHTLQVLSSCPQ